jgi:hypothetical protein
MPALGPILGTIGSRGADLSPLLGLLRQRTADRELDMQDETQRRNFVLGQQQSAVQQALAARELAQKDRGLDLEQERIGVAREAAKPNPVVPKPVSARDAYLKAGLPTLAAAMKADPGVNFEADVGAYSAASQEAQQANADFEKYGLAATNQAMALRRGGLDPEERAALERDYQANLNRQEAAYSRMQKAQSTVNELRKRYGGSVDTTEWKPLAGSMNTKLGKELISHGGAEVPVALRQQKITSLEKRLENLPSEIAMTTQGQSKEARSGTLMTEMKKIRDEISKLEDEIADLVRMDNEFFQSFARDYKG